MSQVLYEIEKIDGEIEIACRKYSDGGDYISNQGLFVDQGKIMSALAFIKDITDREGLTGKDLWEIFFKIIHDDYETYEYEE